MLRKITICGLVACLVIPLCVAKAQEAAPSVRETLRIGRGSVQGVEWQPSGNILLVSTIASAWLYTDTLTETGHIEDVRLATFSPDGTLISAIDRENRVTLWDSMTLDPVAAFGKQDAYAIDLAWSPAGDALATVDQVGRIRVWGVDTRSLLVEARFERATELAWSPNGAYLAMIDADGNLHVADSETGHFIVSAPALYRPGEAWGAGIIWRNEAQLLRCTLWEYATCELWDVQTGEVLMLRQAGGMRQDFSPNGELLASATLAGTSIWNPDTGAELARFGDRQTTITRWSPDGQWIASGDGHFEAGASGDILIGDSQGQIMHVLQAARNWVEEISWNDDSDRLVSVGVYGELKTWRASDGTELGFLDAYTYIGNVVTWSPEGNTIAVAGTLDAVRLWNTATGDQLATLSGHPQPIAFVEWQPDGRLLATSTQGPDLFDSIDNTIRIWETRRLGNSARPRVLLSHDERIAGIKWSRDGDRLASVDIGGTLSIWEPATDSIVLDVELSEIVGWCCFSIVGLDWSQNGDWLYIQYFSSGGGGGWFIDPQTGEQRSAASHETRLPRVAQPNVLFQWTVHRVPFSALVIGLGMSSEGTSALTERLLEQVEPERITGIIMDEQGTALAGILTDRSVAIWSVPDAQFRFRLGGLDSVVWSPDGTILAGLRDGQPAQLYNACNGQPIAGLERYFYRLNERVPIVWSLDQNQVAQKTDGVLNLWDIPSEGSSCTDAED